MTAEMPTQPPYQSPSPAPPPPPRRSSAWRWGCGFALGGCLLLVMLAGLLMLLAVMSSTGEMGKLTAGGERIALIRIDGMIVAGESGFSMLGGAATGSDDVVRQIERAAEDQEVRGILLRINSPGGSAAGSQEIFHAVQKARAARKKPFVVVASMADVAASGGYYVAAASDRIFADPATITGSIGALAMHQDMSGLLDKIGVKPEVIKSGRLKDMLNPAAPLSQDARQVVHTLVEQVHEQFIQAVVEGRGMKESAVRRLADGRIYIGQQAKENGLVDELGGFQAALEAAGKLADIKGKPRFKEYRPPSFWRWLLGSTSSAGRHPVAVTGGLLYDGFADRLARGALEPGARPGEM